MSGQLHAPVALSPGERAPSTHWIGGWLGPTADLEDIEKRDSNSAPLGRPARSQSLYRLRYRGSTKRT
jgi:hypothetical protein